MVKSNIIFSNPLVIFISVIIIIIIILSIIRLYLSFRTGIDLKNRESFQGIEGFRSGTGIKPGAGTRGLAKQTTTTTLSAIQKKQKDNRAITQAEADARNKSKCEPRYAVEDPILNTPEENDKFDKDFKLYGKFRGAYIKNANTEKEIAGLIDFRTNPNGLCDKRNLCLEPKGIYKYICNDSAFTVGKGNKCIQIKSDIDGSSNGNTAKFPELEFEYLDCLSDLKDYANKAGENYNDIIKPDWITAYNTKLEKVKNEINENPDSIDTQLKFKYEKQLNKRAKPESKPEEIPVPSESLDSDETGIEEPDPSDEPPVDEPPVDEPEQSADEPQPPEPSVDGDDFTNYRVTGFTNKIYSYYR